MNPNLARTLKFREEQGKSMAYGNAVAAKDWNNCTVIAFHILVGCPYIEAYNAIKSVGRKFWNGLDWGHIPAYLALFEKFGFLLERVDHDAPSGPGKFLVLYYDHAAAVIDGMVQNGKSQRPVYAIYRVVDCR